MHEVNAEAEKFGCSASDDVSRELRIHKESVREGKFPEFSCRDALSCWDDGSRQRATAVVVERPEVRMAEVPSASQVEVGAGSLVPWRDVPSPCLLRPIPRRPRPRAPTPRVASVGASIVVGGAPVLSSQRRSISLISSPSVSGWHNALTSATLSSLRVRSVTGATLSEEEAGRTRRKSKTCLAGHLSGDELRSRFIATTMAVKAPKAVPKSASSMTVPIARPGSRQRESPHKEGEQ